MQSAVLEIEEVVPLVFMGWEPWNAKSPSARFIGAGRDGSGPLYRMRRNPPL